MRALVPTTLAVRGGRADISRELRNPHAVARDVREKPQPSRDQHNDTQKRPYENPLNPTQGDAVGALGGAGGCVGACAQPPAAPV